MPKSKKRKSDNGGGLEELQKRPRITCILHVPSIEHLDFTPFSQVQGSAAEKLAQLHGIRDRRLAEPLDSPYRMKDICNHIPESLDGADLETIGYHRGCYQNFTKNQNRLKCSADSNEAPTSRSHRNSASSLAMKLFPLECIFCGKLEVKVSGKTERCSKFPVFKDKDGALKDPTWKQIEPRALELGLHQLHRLVQGEDLFAREANFHRSCHKSFNLKYTNHLRKAALFESGGTDTEQNLKASAHLKAFTAVIQYIQDLVIEKNEVVQLASLRLQYIQELERKGFPNPGYRSEKLKVKLEKHDIHQQIAFAKVNPGDKGCITYHLVYNSSISVADAVTYAYKLGSKDKYEYVALLLRSIIQQAFTESKSLPWPPTADDLEIKYSDEVFPLNLMKFLNLLISGDADMEKSEKTRRIVLSIGQVCIYHIQ